MQLNEELLRYSKLSARTKILQETYHTEGLLKGIVDTNMKNLKTFGSVIKDVSKLIGNEIGFLSQFLDPRLKSWETWDKRRKNHANRKKGILSSLNSNLDAFDEGDALTKLALNPGGWCFGVTMKGSPHNLLKKENREAIGKYGLDKVPAVGWIFESSSDWEKGDFSPWDKFVRELSDDPDPEKVALAFAAWQGNPMGWAKEKTSSKLGFAMDMLKKAQKLFLITDGDEHGGDVLIEGEEEEEAEKEKGELSDYPELEKLVIAEVTKYIEDNWPVDRDKYLENHQNFFDGIIDEASKTLGLIGKLSSTEDPKEFFKALKDLVKEQKSFDLDVNDMENKFGQSAEAVKSNKEAMEKIEKSMSKDSEEPPSAEDMDAKIASIVLTGFKSKFLQGVKNNLTEFYERIYNDMTEGLEEDVLKDSQNKYDKKYLELTIGYRNKLTEAISNFKQS